MNLTDDQLDRYRARWWAERERLRLADVQDGQFGTVGLAARVPHRSVRLLILPGDPLASPVNFDESFWGWWPKPLAEPSVSQRIHWHDSRPTASTAVRFSIDNSGWERYLALHRSGALELELGSDGVFTAQAGKYLRLLTTVGHIWAAMATYGRDVSNLGIAGPWEVTIALQGLCGTRLAHVAEGWQEPSRGFADDHTALAESNVLLRREIVDWPQGNDVWTLVYELGAMLEDTFGYRQRRFVASSGALTGEFDINRFG